jgi:uncharacterized protein (TIGR03435 family)
MSTSAVMIAAFFSRASAQDTGRLEFEVAVVKPASVDRITEGATSSSRVSNGRLEVRGYTLKALIRMAYRIQDYQIVGGPKWFDVDSYDIDAKSPLGANVQQIPQRLQSLLADRFQLVIHDDTRNRPVYTLIVAKNGPKLHWATTAGTMGFAGGPRMMRSKGASMRDLAEKLGEALQRPVLDRTGLSGLYEIDLKFAPIALEPSDNGAEPAISAALQEQLGLKLNAARAPVHVIMVDHAEKPSAN